MSACFRCGATIEGRIYRTTVCESCGADAKVCLNCEFYDPSSHWECRETIAERVREKDRANFCDFFRASGTRTDPQERNKEQSRAEASRDAFSKLFGDE